MTEWKQVSLDKITIKITDGSHHSPKESVDGIPMFSVKDMREQGFYSENAKTISESDYQKLIKSGCQPEIDDILIAKDGSVLKHIFRVKTKPDYVLLSSIAIIRPNTSVVEPSFLVYAIKEPSTKELILNNFVGGSGVPRIVLKDFKQVDIPLPPLPEQRAIASILSSLDDKIDLLHRQNKTLEEMAEALFRQWFVLEADDEWRVVKLGDYISTNTTSINKDYPHEKIEYLDTGSLTLGKWGDLKTVPLKEAPSRAKRLVKHNDILYSTVRPNQLHYGIVRNPIEKLVVSTGFCVITCNSVSPYFVYYLLTDNGMTEYLHSIAEGSTSAYPSLKPSDLESLEFPFPPVNILEKFHKLVDSAWNKIESNYKQIHTLEKLRDTLLPKLMSGGIRIEAHGRASQKKGRDDR